MRNKIFILFFIITLFSCSKSEKTISEVQEQTKKEVFQCWDVSNIQEPSYEITPEESTLPQNAVPWGGTVSHHLLAGKEIDAWFSELANRRSVERFYILSPSHWSLSLEDWSLTDGSWKTLGGNVDSDVEKVKELKNMLNVKYEPFVFHYEHGVSTLIPFIKRYFPNAKVVSIAYNGEPPVNMNIAKKFNTAIQTVFSIDSKSDFLLVSTDFSHHSNAEKTNEKDSKSRMFLETLDPSLWILGICDNRPAMYIISQLATEHTKCTIQRHTNAYKITTETDPEDITSYFFTYFWEDKKQK